MNTDTLQIYQSDNLADAIASGEVDENRNLVYGTEHALRNLATQLQMHRSQEEIRRNRKRERQNKKRK